MSYVRPATYAGHLYPLCCEDVIASALALSSVQPRRGLHAIFPPYSSFSETLPVLADTYAAVDASRFNQIVIICSSASPRLRQTPFSRLCVAGRDLRVVGVSHAHNIPYIPEIECLNCAQAEIQLPFLGAKFDLDNIRLYILYAGAGADAQFIQQLITPQTLVVCPAEFCAVGIAYGFAPKCAAGPRRYVSDQNARIAAALSGEPQQLLQEIQNANISLSGGIIVAARALRMLGPLKFSVLRQELSAALDGPLDSARSFCAIVGCDAVE